MKNQIYVQNLKCGGCANTIKEKIEKIKGVSDITVVINESLITLNCDEKTLTTVKEILKNAGYPEDGTVNSLGSKAKSYVSCAIGKMN